MLLLLLSLLLLNIREKRLIFRCWNLRIHLNDNFQWELLEMFRVKLLCKPNMGGRKQQHRLSSYSRFSICKIKATIISTCLQKKRIILASRLYYKFLKGTFYTYVFVHKMKFITDINIFPILILPYYLQNIFIQYSYIEVNYRSETHTYIAFFLFWAINF